MALDGISQVWVLNEYEREGRFLRNVRRDRGSRPDVWERVPRRTPEKRAQILMPIQVCHPMVFRASSVEQTEGMAKVTVTTAWLIGFARSFLRDRPIGEIRQVKVLAVLRDVEARGGA
jgi:hypothetical protein